MLGVIVETQLRRDDRKHYTWPQYAMNARARHKCPCVVVVVTASPAVARWAGRPIDVGNGTVFRQRIIGPRSIPKLTDPERATHEPELAVLSAWSMDEATRPAHDGSQSPPSPACRGSPTTSGCYTSSWSSEP